jgi:transcriptional regulator with XRE-family HTH domain
METISIEMEDPAPDINRRIAAQTRGLRSQRGLSLEALAARCGVSRSMISVIERGEASPTAVILERLAFGLGVPLARLFDAPPDALQPPSPTSRRSDQPLWRDPASGYLRRNVSPPHWPSPLRLVEVEFPAGARVSYETGEREPVVHQLVWVLAGRIRVTVGADDHALEQGDCLAMQLDRPISFANRTRQAARYAVITSAEPPP